MRGIVRRSFPPRDLLGVKAIQKSRKRAGSEVVGDRTEAVLVHHAHHLRGRSDHDPESSLNIVKDLIGQRPPMVEVDRRKNMQADVISAEHVNESGIRDRIMDCHPIDSAGQLAQLLQVARPVIDEVEVEGDIGRGVSHRFNHDLDAPSRARGRAVHDPDGQLDGAGNTFAVRSRIGDDDSLGAEPARILVGYSLTDRGDAVDAREAMLQNPGEVPRGREPEHQ